MTSSEVIFLLTLSIGWLRLIGMITSIESKEMATLYQGGQSSIVIAKKFGVSVPTVFKELKKHGVKSRTLSEARQKYSIDESYFDRIDTHEKAQVLGMIAADGCVPDRKQPTFEITLQREDEYYVEHIKKCFGYDGPIRLAYKKKTGRHYSCLTITSSVLKRQLMAVGIHPRKSLTLLFPTEQQVPREFIASYILGYFEGDGSISLKDKITKPHVSVKICVTTEFGTELQKILKEELDIDSHLRTRSIYRDPKRWKNALTLEFGGPLQVKRFCRWIYANTTFVMKRKHDVFLRLLSFYDENDNLIRDPKWKEQFREKMLATFKKNGTRPARPPKIKPHFVSPNGTVYHVHRLRFFAREMNLLDVTLYRMARGLHKNDHRGWSLASPDQIAAARASGTLVEKFY